jgi:hypothetical protein
LPGPKSVCGSRLDYSLSKSMKGQSSQYGGGGRNALVWAGTGHREKKDYFLLIFHVFMILY